MLRSAVFNWGAKIVAAMLNLCTIILISRLLGPEGRGICAWYLVVIAGVLVVSEIAAGSASIFLVHHISWKRIAAVAWKWNVMAALFVTTLLFILGKLSLEDAGILTCLGWLNAWYALHCNFLLGYQQLGRFNFIQMLVPAATLATFGLFYASGLKSPYAYVAAIGVSWSTGWILAKKGLLGLGTEGDASGRDVGGWKEMFAKGGANQLGHLASILNNRLLYFLLPASILGPFSNSLSLAEAILILPGSMGQVMYAKLSGRVKKEEGVQMLRSSIWGNFIVMLLLYSIILVIPASWFDYVFGLGFAATKPLLRALVPGILAFSIYLIFSYYYSAQGKFLNNLYPLVAALLIQLIIIGTFSINNSLSVKFLTICLSISYFISAIVMVLLSSREIPGFARIWRPPSVVKVFQRMTAR